MFRRPPFVVVVAAAAVCAAAPAFAEGEQEGINPFFDESGELVGGSDSNGFATLDGGDWAQTCMETFDDSGGAAKFSFLTNDGTLIVGGRICQTPTCSRPTAGLAVSHDLGCTFEDVAEFAGRSVVAFAQGDGALFVSTADFNQANSVFISVDGGVQWSSIFTAPEGTQLNQLAVSVDGTRIVSSGAHGIDIAVFVSTDTGLSFDDVSAAYTQFNAVALAGLSYDVDDSAILFGGFNQDAVGIVVRAADPYDAPESLGTFPSQVTHIAVSGGARFALAKLAKKVFKQTPDAGDFVEVSDGDAGPTACLYAKRDGSGLVGCGKTRVTLGAAPNETPMFLESADGATWDPVVRFTDVHYRTCPDGTPGSGQCARFLEKLQCADGVDNDFDGTADCDDSECAVLVACGGTEGEGEGAAGEGEGAVGAEGEGPGTPPPSCACASSSSSSASAASSAWAGLGAAIVLAGVVRRRRRRR